MSDIDRLAKDLAASEYLGFGGDSWNGLTFGEQQQYRKEACRTAGAVYKSRVTERSIHFSVELPQVLSLSGLTEKEAAGHEAYLHKKMEDAIVWILEWRRQRPAYTNWSELRQCRICARRVDSPCENEIAAKSCPLRSDSSGDRTLQKEI